MSATATLALSAAGARAEPPSAPAAPPPRATEPREVTGVVRPPREPGDVGRALAEGVLWLPRSVVELLFLTTGSAAGLIQDEQFVPRAREVFFTREGTLGVFPTFFLETGTSPNVGARLISDVGPTATTLRVGYGGPDTAVAESRLRFAAIYPVPAVVSLDGLYDRRTGLAFLGVGQQPFDDPRNHFLGAPRAGLFRERRERGIVSLGVRPKGDVELFLSSSLTQRRTDDMPGAGSGALTDVLASESIPGASEPTRVVYTELAVRYDSRPGRYDIAKGALFETYGGIAQQILEGDSRFARTGARAAAFVPVSRSTNIVSPRLVLDGLAHVAGGPVPFRELVEQPSFRGFDTRRDHVSLVASLDYRWEVMRFVAAHVFADGATVGPSLGGLDLAHPRPAWGFGVDLHSSDAELGRLAFAFSPEGFTFNFSFGASARFGDRQHRD